MKRMNLVLAVLALVAGGVGQVRAGPELTIDDTSGNIGIVDVANGNVHVIGNAGVVLTDIGYSPTGQLFGIDFNNLYTVNTTTGAATLVGPTSVPGDNALVFGKNGLLYAAGFSNDDLYTLNPATGASTDITPQGQGIAASAGDLAFVGSTLYESDTSGDLIAITLNAAGNQVVSETDVGSFGFSNVFGQAEGGNGVLYGVSGTEIFSVNLATGQGTLVTNYGGQGLGAANGTSYFTEAVTTATVPEPGSLTLLGIGIAGLGGYAWRRRKTVAAIA